jgi:hypothetical protein
MARKEKRPAECDFRPFQSNQSSSNSSSSSSSIVLKADEISWLTPAKPFSPQASSKIEDEFEFEFETSEFLRQRFF